MEDFEKYIDNNADEEERRAAAQVREGLTGLRLEAKVREVAAERAALLRRAFWLRVKIAVAVLLLAVGAGYYFFGKKRGDAPPNVPQQEQRLDQPANTPPKDKKIDAKKIEPIAQVRPSERLSKPRYPAPDVTMIRGDEEADKAQKALLNKIWYTDYPLTGLRLASAYKDADQLLQQRDFNAAYLELSRLERVQADSLSRRIERRNKKRMEEDSTYRPVAALTAPNDTLLYLKAYCMLEMGEGLGAMVNFGQIRTPDPAWMPQIEWYRSLAMTLAGEKEKALAVFREIAAQKGHRYRREAEKAVIMMNDK